MQEALNRFIAVLIFLLFSMLTVFSIGKQQFYDDETPGLEYKPDCCPCPVIEEDEPSYG